MLALMTVARIAKKEHSARCLFAANTPRLALGNHGRLSRVGQIKVALMILPELSKRNLF